MIKVTHGQQPSRRYRGGWIPLSPAQTQQPGLGLLSLIHERGGTCRDNLKKNRWLVFDDWSKIDQPLEGKARQTIAASSWITPTTDVSSAHPRSRLHTSGRVDNTQLHAEFLPFLFLHDHRVIDDYVKCIGGADANQPRFALLQDQARHLFPCPREQDWSDARQGRITAHGTRKSTPALQRLDETKQRNAFCHLVGTSCKMCSPH